MLLRFCLRRKSQPKEKARLVKQGSSECRVWGLLRAQHADRK
jgi:hypothetical protein